MIYSLVSRLSHWQGMARALRAACGCRRDSRDHAGPTVMAFKLGMLWVSPWGT